MRLRCRAPQPAGSSIYFLKKEHCSCLDVMPAMRSACWKTANVLSMLVYYPIVNVTQIHRNLRCFSFAKLYFTVGDYENACRYVSSYLSVKPKSAEGHQLLGKALEKLGKKKLH
ncbi:hypothetical protein NQ317_008616 [Molorchus minor]|uniref:Uncharacterized protein n=1 Tax=Molorchus minor TaxID=1323400 RepID=A0ABQ9IYZ0_9CUCU|nr:hypothetical protein NQ317_008616 [Molorchus minor]